MGNLSQANKKELARIYFVVNGLSAKEAAAKVEVSENTFGKWVDKYKWKSLKAAEIGKVENLINALEDDIIRIREQATKEKRPLNAQEADSIYKTTLSIRNLSKDFGIDVYNAVLQEFLNYSREIDSNFQQRGVDLCDGFLVMKLKQRGN
jgi:transposase